jgi:hypothetical protein
MVTCRSCRSASAAHELCEPQPKAFAYSPCMFALVTSCLCQFPGVGHVPVAPETCVSPAKVKALVCFCALHLQAACGGPNAPLSFEGTPWNSSTVAVIAAAKAHTEMVLLQVGHWLCVMSSNRTALSTHAWFPSGAMLITTWLMVLDVTAWLVLCGQPSS